MRSMLKLPLIIVCSILVSGFSYAASLPIAIESVKCSWMNSAQLVAVPLDSGPLLLKSVHCLEPSTPRGLGSPQLSPDGNWLLLHGNYDEMWLTNIHKANARSFRDGALARLPEVGATSLVWAPDSRSVLGVKRETQRNGFSTGPLKPTLFSVDGSTQPLPEFTNLAGPLDELYWVGNTGLAIAAFGTRGDYYKPEHVDENPTIAIVDARNGKVIQAVALASLPDFPSKRIFVVNGRLDSRGRVHALIAFPHRWVEWNQGEAPRMAPLGEEKNIRTQFALAPDGKHVLMMQGLSASGPICEIWSRGKCPPPTPRSGSIAKLREISTGKIVWSIDGIARNFRNDNDPVISSDGRYALISIPAESGTVSTSVIALISMADGKVLQKINHYSKAFGFSSDGKAAWIADGAFVAKYSIRN